MALVSRSMALALPLVLGLACTHARSSHRTDTAAQDRGVAAASNQDISGNAAQPQTGHSDDQIVAGRVTDVTDDSISIDSGQGTQKTLYLVPQTVVTIDGQDASPADIQQGQDVRASFNTQDGRDVAVRIESGRATDKG